MRKICLIDYGQGNLGSVYHGFSRLGREVQILTQPKDTPKEAVLVLPGVGSFDSGIRRLDEKYWPNFLRAWSEEGKSLIGICLGMQLLTDGSDEGALGGLGIFSGRCRLNPAVPESGIRVPNLGWRQVDGVVGSRGVPLIPSDARFYFSHSYHFESNKGSDTIANAYYGSALPAVIFKQRTMGVQFHPEKSQKHGMAFLRNALSILDSEGK